MNIIKKIKESILCLFFIVLVLSCTATGEKESYQDIDAKAGFEMIQNKNPLILDVRTPAEYQAGHIKNSILIPVQVLSTEYKSILEYQGKSVLIYCRSGNRSVTASKILLENGFKPIYNLKGGIKSWIKNGYPVEK